MLIKKTSQTTSTQAQVVDGYSTSSRDSYSCNYVNNIKEVYSTSEVLTNKVWIDGKPIYQIVFTGTGGDNTTIGTVSNLDTMVSISGYIKSTYGQWWCVPNYYYANNSTNYWTSLYISDDGAIRLATGSYYTSNSPYYFICEYTKTTDVAS